MYASSHHIIDDDIRYNTSSNQYQLLLPTIPYQFADPDRFIPELAVPGPFDFFDPPTLTSPPL
jgi:hypothetical protein